MSETDSHRRVSPWVVGVALAAAVSLFMPGNSRDLLAAGGSSVRSGGLVSFTFDDGRLGIYDFGAPILAKYGITATFYVSTDVINDRNPLTMTWSEVTDLHRKFNWEIGNHTRSHARLTEISNGRIRSEIRRANRELRQHGIETSTFAYPFGALDDRVVDVVSDHFAAARHAIHPINSAGRLDHLRIRSYWPDDQVSAESVIGRIEDAVKKREWFVLQFHDIVSGDTQGFDYPAAEFEKIVRYVARHGIPTATIADAMALGQENLVPNGDFDIRGRGGIVNWTLENTENIALDRRGRGAYPTPKTSIHLQGTKTQNTLWSSRIPVSANRTYALSWFVRLENLRRQGHGLWIDEYDKRGQQISGQFAGGRYDESVTGVFYRYVPSSKQVKEIRLAAFTEAGARLDLFVDSIRLAESPVR